MTKDEKLAIAWITLDGFLWRNFFSVEQYDTQEFGDTLEFAFRPYHRYISGADRTEHDFLMLIHFQNLVERNLKAGDERLGKLKPVELTLEIANAAHMEILTGREYKIFTAHRGPSRLYDDLLSDGVPSPSRDKNEQK